MESMLVIQLGTLLHKNGKPLAPPTVLFFLRCATVHKAEVPAAGDAAEEEAVVTMIALRILALSLLIMTPRHKQLDNQKAHAVNVAVAMDVGSAEGLMDPRIRLDSSGH
jgi:hypothetical protein